MNDINGEVNISELNQFYNKIIFDIKDNKITQFIKERETEIDLTNINNRTYIVNLCFDNIIQSKNNIKNYLLITILFEKGIIKENQLNKEKLSQIYKEFKNFFIAKKNKEKEKKLELNLNKNHPSDLLQKSKDEIDDLPNINLQIKFLSKIYYLFTDKKELVDFIIKEILDDIIIEDKNIIIKEFIENKNNFETKENLSKIEAQFYIRLFLEINHLEDKLDFSIEKNIKINKINQSLDNILCVEDLWNIFSKQKNQETIAQLVDIIYQLYNITNNVEKLLIKCKIIFQNNIEDNPNIIHLMKYIITQTEKDCVINVKPHYLLCKKNIIKINLEEKKDEIKELYFFGNCTIKQIYYYLTKIDDKKNVLYSINNINEIDDNKALNELEKKLIIISKKEIEKNISSLLNKEKLSEKFYEVLKNLFNLFSKGNDKLTRVDLAECFNMLAGKKEKLFTEKSNKIYFFLKQNSDNLEYIVLDKFINFFYLSVTKGNKEDVWMNIENMNLRNDLSKIPQIKDNKFLPRYYLSNKTEEKEQLYLMDIFKEKYKKSLNKDLYDFIFFLSTEEIEYDYILKNFNKDENMKFIKRQDEYLYNLYIMNIIESIFEDVEFQNNNKLKEYEVNENGYDLYKSDNNKDFKNKFFVEFLKNNYSDLIDYSINNLKKINMLLKEKIDLQDQYIAIKLYKNNLEIINRIYNYYHNIYFDHKKEEITFGKIPLKEFIEANNLSNYINQQNNYKEIFLELMIFLEMYFLKDSKNKENIQCLADISFYLFISLLYKNKSVFDYIKNDYEKSALLGKIINNILTNNQKNKQYIINLLKITSYREDIYLYLIDQAFNLLTNFGEKKLENLTILFISNNLLSNGINKENIKRKIKQKILSVFYNCLNDEENNNKSGAFLQVFLKLFENQKQLKNELMEEKYNNISLCDLIFKYINKREEEKLKKKFVKFDNFKKKISLENDKDKFISYDFAKKYIEEIFNNKNDSQNNKNTSKESNKTINDFLITNFKSSIVNNPNNKKTILDILSKLKQLINEENKEFLNNIPQLENKKRIKKTCPYVGIKNLGSLCYIGSIMQQLFWIPKFKHSILSANDSKPIDGTYELTDDDNILHQTQRLFTYLTFSSYGDFIPKNFIFSLKIYGERINVNQMQDSSEFYLNFCDLIKTSLDNTEYKNLIDDIFIGKTLEKKICSECNNLTHREEEFKSISLEVKDMKNIFQSLDTFISEEIIDEYKCDNCNNKVKLKKSTIISSLPNILVLHLKKMEYNNQGELEKIDSKFDFPLELNLKKYCSENNSVNDNYFKYNLKGINIHKGSANGGHYISLIKIPKEENKWYLFDDSFIEEYNIEKYNEDFNKEGNNDSAYILFYEAQEEKKTKTNFKEYLPIDYLLEVFNDNKIYEYLNGIKVIDINNNLVKLFMDIIDNESFKLSDKKLYYYDTRDLIDIMIDLIINFYSNENNRKNKEQKEIKSIVNIINKIILPVIKEENIVNEINKLKICQQIQEKLFLYKNIQLIFTNNELEELNEKIYELILVLIDENKKNNNIFSKSDFQEMLSKIIDKEKNISVYLYKILYGLITYYPNAELQQLDNNSFLDLFYKIEKESEENLKEISKIFDYYISKKNIIEYNEIQGNEALINELKQNLNDNLFKLLFDGAVEALVKLIHKIQYNDKEASNRFNIDIIQKLYTYCLKEKDNDKIRQKQIKLIKLTYNILEIKDLYVLDRIKILLGFPSLIILSSGNTITKFGVSILNNDINNELFEYSNYNLMKKDRCVLSYLFPSSYYKNGENKLEEKDKCDLIYELLIRALGLYNDNEGNFFLFKTLYLMQSRSIKYDNLYQEMKCILEKTKNDKYDLDKIKKTEKEIIQYFDYELNSTMKILLSNNMGIIDNYVSKPKLPKIYIQWEKLLGNNFNTQFIGCISDIFPYEIGKIEVTLKLPGKKLDVFGFKFYTTFFTKQELTELYNDKKPFIYQNIKREKPQINNDRNYLNNEEKIFYTDFSIFEEKKDIKEVIIYLTEKLKDYKKVIIENKEILNKYEIKNILNKYYILSKDKKTVIKSRISIGEMNLDEINNCYMPEYIYNSIEENQVINLFNIHAIKEEFKFFENNDIGIYIKCYSYEKYFKEIFE